MTSLGFVLLTHTRPKQIARLISTLNRMFVCPPIACHHDFGQCNLPTDIFTSNVSFVQPPIPTRWARFSVIDGMFRALETMYNSENSPDWFILLSGTDYPIKPAERILEDLSASTYDAHVHHEKIIYKNYKTDWQELCYERYCTARFSIPFENPYVKVDHRLPQLTRRVVTLRHPILTKIFLPFSQRLHCFAGEFWFTANRKTAKYLIEYHKTQPALAAHYRKLEKFNIMFPEESYCQTVLCNSNLKISSNHWRYIDWSQGWAPRTLLLEDFDRLEKCTAHFARKFDADKDSSVLDALDKLIVNGCSN